MSDNNRINLHGERLMKLETRMDNHEKSIDEFRKEQKWQTRQLMAAIGGLVVVVYVLDIIFKK